VCVCVYNSALNVAAFKSCFAVSYIYHYFYYGLETCTLEHNIDCRLLQLLYCVVGILTASTGDCMSFEQLWPVFHSGDSLSTVIL